jgi:hypothetical protein
MNAIQGQSKGFLSDSGGNTLSFKLFPTLEIHHPKKFDISFFHFTLVFDKQQTVKHNKLTSINANNWRVDTDNFAGFKNSSMKI